MFNRIRNAQAVSKEKVNVPFSNLRFEIASILKEKGFVKEVKKRKQKGKKTIEIVLKYDKEQEPAIRGIIKISKPGQRIYVKAEEIKILKGGYGIKIVSTSKGIMTGREARKQKIGGEMIAEIW